MIAVLASGVETLEEFDELPAAVAVSDERMDLPGKQVDSGQQAQRARAKVAWTPGLGGKSGAVVAMAWIPGFSSRKLNRLQTASPNISWTDVENDLVAAYCRVVARKLGLAAA